jgi:hypothetical protein
MGYGSTLIQLAEPHRGVAVQDEFVPSKVSSTFCNKEIALKVLKG